MTQPRTIDKRKPTQADVARRAAVSQAMVSYVLSGNPAISIPVETRQRVLDAVAELRYVPNQAARSLRTRKTLTIAGAIPDITNPFYPALERGIQDVAETHGYDLIAVNTDGVADKERKFLTWALQGRVDGLIITPFHLAPGDFAPLLEAGVVVVVLGHMPPTVAGHPIDSLTIDNVAAAQTAVNYLIDRGHTRIGMIAGESGTPPREGRVEGYRRALATHQIPLDDILIRAGDFTEAGGYEGMRDLLTISPRPTALFAANDLMAMGAMIALREAGLAVPTDMAIIGFDDIPAARLVSPRLTTIAQFPERLGRRAAEMLFERLRGEAPATGRFEGMDTKLIVGESA